MTISKTLVRAAIQTWTEEGLMTAAVVQEPFLIREGSSLRTQEELDLIFVNDVHDIAMLDPDPATRELAEGLLNEARAAYLEEGGFTNYDLEPIADSAHWLLWDLGFHIEWNDGYVIWKA